MSRSTTNVALGLCCIAFALVLAFIWIPSDTETWLVERKRGSYIVGDSLAPTLAAAMILISGVLLLLERGGHDAKPNRQNLIFIGAMICIGVVGILLIRWAGPTVTALLAGGEDYRVLRDSAPWKYIGFFIGGTVMIFSMIGFVEERLSLRALVIAVVAVIGIIALYDLPFDDVLLPPNGDV